MKLRRPLIDLPIRYKIFAACAALFLPFAILAGIFSYSVMHKALAVQIDRELSNSTESMRNLVQTSVDLSIRNYLRSVAEKNREIVNLFYRQQLSGKLSETEARTRATEVLLSQKIDKSGYIYCLDSTGTITVHPEPGVLGRNLAEIPFIIEQMQRKNGYIEYDWKNPGDVKAKPKALWMSYFQPWDWIISATAYRDEFDQVVNIDDFRKSIESFRLMGSGYSYVLNLAGDLIVHPLLQNANVFASGLETPDYFFKTLLTQRKGRLYYDWKNPGESRPRQKVVVFDYVPEVDWVVASSAYLDDIYRPLHILRNMAILIGSLCLLGGSLVAMRISSSITRPLRELTERFAVGATGDYSVRMEQQSKDEIGKLARFFNSFMEQLDRETRERKRLERQISEADDQERIRMGQDLHDDLAPHLIGTEVLCRSLHKKLLLQAPEQAEQAETIRALISESTQKTRALARGLCSIHLGEEGLRFALNEFAGTVASIFPVTCRVSGKGEVELPKAVAIHIYRIAQEAIQNAIKHAKAQHIEVILEQDSERLLLEVHDDGMGFAVNDPPDGMGLQIMQFRARIIDAELAIESRIEQGTVVRLILKNMKES
jgi:signal transduction histidine kinase